jgi:hypothetical protein
MEGIPIAARLRKALELRLGDLERSRHDWRALARLVTKL